MSNTTCLIPARGGSKRLPHKNIVSFCNKPLIAWSILQALKSEVFDGGIYVSTDDIEIGNIALKYGANWIERPAEISQDDTPSISVVSHFINKIKSDIVVLMQPTNPLRTQENIKSFVEHIKSKEFKDINAVYSAYLERVIPTVYYEMFDKKPEIKTLSFVTGLLYGIKTSGICGITTQSTTVYEVEPWQSHEIDNYKDVPICESLFHGMGLDREIL